MADERLIFGSSATGTGFQNIGSRKKAGWKASGFIRVTLPTRPVKRAEIRKISATTNTIRWP